MAVGVQDVVGASLGDKLVQTSGNKETVPVEQVCGQFRLPKFIQAGGPDYITGALGPRPVKYSWIVTIFSCGGNAIGMI
tara:strand:- start:36 stop:272 length:237 start_codon:yes stop_codon:yes gene_type:complete